MFIQHTNNTNIVCYYYTYLHDVSFIFLQGPWHGKKGREIAFANSIMYVQQQQSTD